MAKGDANKVQNQIDSQGGAANNSLQNLWGQNTDRTTDFQKLYQGAQERNLPDYAQGMSGFDNLIGRNQNSYSQFVDPKNNPSAAGYANFAETGGFSPEDIASIRARSVAPIHGIADNARREIGRAAAIHGGSSPNTTAALAKSARDTAYAAGDISTNAEANIAQLRQQGKLYGLAGLAGNRGMDLNAMNSMFGNEDKALSGKTSLYGTTPGLTSMFGNQVLNSAQQGLGLGGQQNQLAQMLMSGQLGKAQVPGDFQSGLGNLGSIFNLAGSLVNPISSLFKPKAATGAA